MPRPYGDSICSDPSNNDYPGPRPMSPIHSYSNRSANGFSYRGGALAPNGNIGAPLFSSQHHPEAPYNHQLFNCNVNGSHENKLPNSPSNAITPLDGNVNRANTGQHSYSNLQVCTRWLIEFTIWYAVISFLWLINNNFYGIQFRTFHLQTVKLTDQSAFHLQVLIIQAKIRYRQHLHHPAVWKGLHK